jgi:hypothetical protein
MDIACQHHLSYSHLAGGRMATLSELVETLAEVEGIDPAAVAVIARSVREAGLITTGGRGLSAARMTYSDAANLMIAVNAAPTAREAPQTVHSYRNLQAWDRPLAYKGQIPKRPTFLGRLGDALEQLVQCAAIGKLPEIFLKTSLDKLLVEEFSKANVEVELTFQKPIPFVSLSVSVVPRARTGAVEPRTVIAAASTGPRAGFSFELSKASRSHLNSLGDRREWTSIGYPTIREIGGLFRANATQSTTGAVTSQD